MIGYLCTYLYTLKWSKRAVIYIVSASPQLHDGVRPTLQELEKFEATPEEVELEGE